VPAVKFGYGLIGIAPDDTASLLLFAGIRFCLAGVILLVLPVAYRVIVTHVPLVTDDDLEVA